MGYIRRKTSDDATWQRAWTADTVADLATISAILGSERPHHGDIAFVTADSNYYLWLDNGSWAQITGLGAGSISQSTILGMDGIDGNDGFTIPGPAGPTGATGATGAGGANGLQGPPGLDGKGDSYSGPIGNSSGPIDLSFGSRGALPTLFDISAAGGGQIKFPSTPNPSTDTNTLDDYEEGTWTPVIGGSSGESGQAYASQVGRYVKIGKVVVAIYQVQFSTRGTISGHVRIKGWPFTIDATLGAQLGTAYWVTVTSFVYLGGVGINNTTQADIYGNTVAAPSMSFIFDIDLDNSSQFAGGMVYIAKT